MKTLTKFLLTSSTILIFQTTLAGSLPTGEEFHAEGRMVTFKYVPGDKVGKLFVFGKKQADLDFRKDHKLLSITAMGQGRSEILQFKDNGDSYEISNAPSWKEPYELSIRSKLREETEEIRVRIKRKK